MTSTQKGFTLIELLVVIAIIGLLSAVVLASLTSARERAIDTKRLAELRQVQSALEMYYSANGLYPLDVPAGNYRLSTISGSLVGTYITQIPLDPEFGDTNGGYLYGSDNARTMYTLLVRLNRNNNAWCEIRSGAGDPHWSYTPC